MTDKIIERSTYPLLGLPFDAVDMDEAVSRVIGAVESNQKLFISTPNLNFVMSALRDESFRQSVINSDLSVADGMPIVWIAKLLNVPLIERVSGSGLVEALMRRPKNEAIKVFFFGGPEGVAEIAHNKLQEQSCGLESVGWYYPGFGSIQDMSQESILATINKCEPDFVIVALGARKGQEWIEVNRDKLTAPVISHLGAVVNFVAGTASRAPVFFQKTGLEWLWRIKEEPALWKRYFFDGMNFLKLFLTKVIPLFWINFLRKREGGEPPNIIACFTSESVLEVSIEGNIRAKDLYEIKQGLSESWRASEIIINLSNTTFVESEFIGFLLLLSKEKGTALKVLNASSVVRKVFSRNCVVYLLSK